MRLLILCLTAVTLILSSCQPRTVCVGQSIQKIDAEEFSRLVINFSHKMKRENHLDLEDSYIVYNDFVQKAVLKYSSQRLLTLCQARLLIVELVEEFLSRINNHTLLGFQVDPFPFTADNLEVRLNFESFFGVYVDPLYIGQVWLKDGCVYFYAEDYKDLFWADWGHHRFEPYFKSKELALLKREADFPYISRDDNPPIFPPPEEDESLPKEESGLSKKLNQYIFDRQPPAYPTYRNNNY